MAKPYNNSNDIVKGRAPVTRCC